MNPEILRQLLNLKKVQQTKHPKEVGQTGKIDIESWEIGQSVNPETVKKAVRHRVLGTWTDTEFCDSGKAIGH